MSTFCRPFRFKMKIMTLPQNSPLLMLLIISLTLTTFSILFVDSAEKKLTGHYKLRDRSCNLNNTFMECIKKCRQILMADPSQENPANINKDTSDYIWQNAEEEATNGLFDDDEEVGKDGNKTSREPETLRRLKEYMRKEKNANAVSRARAFGCLVRCHARPKREICESDCAKNDWLDLIDSCECDFNNGTTWRQENSDCAMCLKKQTDVNNVTNCVRDRPNHIEDCKKTWETCLKNDNVTDSSTLNKCFGARRLYDDVAHCKKNSTFGPCYNSVTQERIDSLECDMFCLRFAPQSYCDNKCVAEYKDNPEEQKFQADLEQCTFRNPVCNRLCIYRDLCKNGVVEMGLHGCYVQIQDAYDLSQTDEKDISKECELWYEKALEVSDIKKKKFSTTPPYRELMEYLGRFLSDMSNDTILNSVFPGIDLKNPDSRLFDTEYQWIFKRTPIPNMIFECFINQKDFLVLPDDRKSEAKECLEKFLSDQRNIDPSSRRRGEINRCLENRIPTGIKLMIRWVEIKNLSLAWTDVEKALNINLNFSDPSSVVWPPSVQTFGGYVLESDETAEGLEFENSGVLFNVTLCSLTCTEQRMGENFASCVFNAYKTMIKEGPCVYEPPKVIELTDFSNCKWIVDLSLTSNPDRLASSYFNEKVRYDQKDKLLSPNTHQFLQEIEDSSSRGFFVFPYFLIVRAECDGSNYDEAFYKLFMHGGFPQVRIQYWPVTARDLYPSSMQGLFKAALVNLTRNSGNTLVPLNPLEVQSGGGFSSRNAKGCHWKICYPGFAVPLLLYRIPSFEVVVEAQDVFSSLFRKIYVSAYNRRTGEGTGVLEITDDNPANFIIPHLIFPRSKIGISVDNELKKNYECSSCGEDKFCPPIIPHLHDTEEISYLPLDGDDLYKAQFTYLTAPTVVFAGFYDPGLVLIGDPDMNDFNIVRWTMNNPEDEVEIFSAKKENDPAKVKSEIRCLQDDNEALGFKKVIYSQVDYSDPKFPLKYYRSRFSPINHDLNLDTYTPAIYEVISLEDRLLLVTVRGLVQYYGNTNATLAAGKVFKAYGKDAVQRCFKFVRIAERALMRSDLVVGITYTYTMGNEHVDQEIWAGSVVLPGEELKFEEVKSAPSYLFDGTDEEFSPQNGSINIFVGTTESDLNVGDPSMRELEEKSTSEIEKVCFQVINEKMGSDKEQISIPMLKDDKWCEAIDASPHNTIADTFVVLIRMLIIYNGDIHPLEGFNSSQSLNQTDEDDEMRRVYFYVIAQHTLQKSKSQQKLVWEILTIIPRKPCSDEHKESVRNVFLFDSDYFSTEGTLSDGGRVVRGCQVLNKNLDEYVYLTGISFTRMLSSHLFVYGSSLLQSIDAGETFVALKSFPMEDTFHNDKCNYTEKSKGNDDTKASRREEILRSKHRITIMAFDDKGHYAFLTNKRELWIGTTGTLDQTRLRPSPGYSVTQTVMSKQLGLNDAVPFALMYDINENLFEMVAVVIDGQVERIMKRVVPIDLILRNRNLVNRIEEETERKQLAIKNLEPDSTDKERDLILYDPPKWTLYCPFSSAKFSENYSALHSRNQIFLFIPPRQSLELGRAYDERALWAFQVSTYSLTIQAFFRLNYTGYSQHSYNPDPFYRWKQERQEISKIGLLRFLRGDKDKDGILIVPESNRRLISTVRSAGRLFRFYYLDYNIILRLEISFSIKNDASLGTTDYFSQHISQIQLNVDNANGTLLQIDTERVPLPSKASAKFIVTIKVRKSPDLIQGLPGRNPIPIPVLFHLIGGFGNCVKKSTDPLSRDSHSTLIYVGCPPATDLLFNWNKTLYSIKFRDKEAHFGVNEDCYGNEFVCFFAKKPMIFFFDIYDVSKQRYLPYEGTYTMRVVAGGYSEANMLNRDGTYNYYTEDEQEAYNIPGVSDASLIWNEWDLETGYKVDKSKPKKAQDSADGKIVHRENLLKSGHSAVQWACHTLSPCARISPNWGLQTVYWFRIRISNRAVEPETLCLFEREFNIQLYGFPPSPETQLLTTIFFCLGILGILYLLFVCTRSHKRVWKVTKVKVYSWIQIMKDTFPKPLKSHVIAEDGTEARTQQQKDNIILSLQGHLKIPELVPRDSTAGSDDGRGHRRGTAVSRQDSVLSHASSGSSIQSRFSAISQQEPSGLNATYPKSAPNTWTDLVYEQIISKRLAAIVEKNRKMRANILRKTSIQQDGQEKRYEKEHKHTVSEESIFLAGPSKPQPPNK